MKFFFPKQPVFFDLFLKLHGHLREIALLFQEFSATFDDFEEFSIRAKDIEHRADMVAHDIVSTLNTTFITPIDREDIYLLAHELDDIIDLIENAIHNVALYGIKNKKPVISEFARLIVEASSEVGKLIEHLSRQKYTREFNSIVVKIHGLEDQGDFAFQKAIQELFEKERDPLTVIKWKDIIEELENVMDKYQKVSDIIEGIAVKMG